MFEGGNFHSFSLNRECFTTNYGPVDWQCKSTSMLAQKFFRKWQFCTLTAKVFPLESFAIYGIPTVMKLSKDNTFQTLQIFKARPLC